MLKYLLSALNDCITIFNVDEQRYLFISPSVKTVLGVEPADLEKNTYNLQELIDGRDRAETLKAHENFKVNSWIEVSYRIHSNTCDTKWIHEKYSRFIDEHNHTLVIRVFTDVTEKTHSLEEFNRREQFLNSLIDSQTNFLIRINGDGNFTFANRQFFKVFKFDYDEIIGQHFSVTSLPEDRNLCEKAFYDCMNNPGKMIPLIHRKPDKDGGLHWTEWEFISITDDSGQITEIQGVGQDITERIDSENKIIQAAEKLDTFIESITDSFFIIDNAWQFVRVNHAFEKITGKLRADLIGKVIWEVFPTLLATGFEKAYLKASSENVSVQFQEYYPPLKMWFDTLVYPSSEGLTVMVRDISHEKNALEEVVITKNNLEALINNTEDHIWSVDRESRYLYMNNAYRRAVAYFTGEEPVKGAYSYLHKGYSDETIDRWEIYYNRALEGESYTVRNDTFDASGKKISFEISFNPIYKNMKEIIGVGCFARNITGDLEKEQALLEQNERLHHIASLSSHELRRPVASLLGLIQLFDREDCFNPDNEKIIEHLYAVGLELDDVVKFIVNRTFS